MPVGLEDKDRIEKFTPKINQMAKTDYNSLRIIAMKRQIVAGMNYRYTLVGDNVLGASVVALIYRDLDGHERLMSAKVVIPG